MIGPGELGVVAITALQYGYPAFMTIDLGAIALSMMRVEGWGEQIHSVRAGCNTAEPIRQGQNSWYEVLADLQKVFC